jgi:hypothetical protein
VCNIQKVFKPYTYIIMTDSGYKYKNIDLMDMFNPDTNPPEDPSNNYDNTFDLISANSNYFATNKTSEKLQGCNDVAETYSAYLGSNNYSANDYIFFNHSSSSSNIAQNIMVSYKTHLTVNTDPSGDYITPPRSDIKTVNAITCMLVGGGGGHGGSGGNAKVSIATSNSAEGYGGRGGYGEAGSRNVVKLLRKDYPNTFDKLRINIGNAGSDGNAGKSNSKKTNAGFETKTSGGNGGTGGNGGDTYIAFDDGSLIPAMEASGGTGGGGGNGAKAKANKNSNTKSSQGSPGIDSSDQHNSGQNNNNTNWKGNISDWNKYGDGGFQNNGDTRKNANTSTSANNGAAIILYLYD